jgi:hypothetical protein
MIDENRTVAPEIFRHYDRISTASMLFDVLIVFSDRTYRLARLSLVLELCTNSCPRNVGSLITYYLYVSPLNLPGIKHSLPPTPLNSTGPLALPIQR